MLIELSSRLDDDMLNWPTNPTERFEPVLRIDNGDNCNTSSVYHHMHNGTHVDAPMHFSKSGKSIMEIPIEDFYYTAPLIITMKKDYSEYISEEELSAYEDQIKDADILCLYTGFSDLKETDPEAYVYKFPAFTHESAMYLRKGFPKLKAIAIDFMSVDSATEGAANGFPAHKAFLDTVEGDPRTLLLFEDVNLNRLANVQKPVRQICAFPIRWENAEAAPVSMVAITE